MLLALAEDYIVEKATLIWKSKTELPVKSVGTEFKKIE